MLNDTLKDARQPHSTAKKHVSIALSIHEFSLTPTDQALFRDGYRYVVTGKYDISSVLAIKELREKLNADRSLKTDGTQCAHIFAESTNQDIGQVCPYLSA